MYAYIKGELAETNPDHIVIETGRNRISGVHFITDV